eukprot:6959754-Karenia_brevis.AAC.1
MSTHRFNSQGLTSTQCDLEVDLKDFNSQNLARPDVGHCVLGHASTDGQLGADGCCVSTATASHASPVLTKRWRKSELTQRWEKSEPDSM